MAIALRSTTVQTSDSYSTSNTIAVPSGAAAGDIAVLVIGFWETYATSITWPSGFVEVANTKSGNQGCAVAYKVLTGADSGNYVTTFSPIHWNQAHCYMISGADTTSPLEDYAVVTTGGATLSIDTTATTFQVLGIGFGSKGTTTAPTGFTTLSTSGYCYSAYRTDSTTGTRNVTAPTARGSSVYILAAFKEAGSGGTQHTVDDTNNENITDTVSKALAYGRSDTDSEDLTDSVERAVAFNRALQDSEALTDEITTAVAKARSFADSLNITDEVTKSVSKALSVQDSISVTDKISIALSKIFTDDVDISDEVAGAVAFARSADDAVNLTDEVDIGLSGGTIYTVDYTDGLILIETIAKINAKTRTEEFDLVNFHFKDFLKPLTETTQITDEITINHIVGKVSTDAINLTDTANFNYGFSRTDDIYITETVEFTRSTNIVITEDFSLLESVDVTLPNAADYSNDVDITDSASVVLILDTLKPDSISIVDDRRIVVRDFFSMTDDEIRVLTIGDLAYRYWSYLSQLTPVERQSLYDHFKRYAPDGKNWIEDITEQP